VKAVWLRLRVEARSHWRSWLGVALLVGVVSGATIAAFAGARRTETAYDRFLRGTHAFDVAVPNGSKPETINRQFDFDEIARLPQVLDATQLSYYFGEGKTAAGTRITESDLALFASPDGRFGTALNGVRVLHGRLPTRDNEMVMSLLAAGRLGVHAGQDLRLAVFGPKAMATGGVPPATTLRVVGVVAIQGGFPPLTGGLPPLGMLSSGYTRTHLDAAHVLAVRLRDGTRGISAFDRELVRRAADPQVVTSNQIEIRSPVQRGLDVQATALRLLGFVVAGVTLLLLGQALARLGNLEADDDDVLRGLGFTGSQLRARALGRGAAMAVVAAVTATITAVLLSALTPVGVGRQAELHPGIAVNVAYLGVGVVIVIVFVVVLSIIPAVWISPAKLRSRRRSTRITTGSRVGGALASAGASTAASAGVRMALEPGRGRTSVPVRSTIISAILGVAVIAGVLGFSASLARLLDDPHLYGWNWDIQVGDLFAPNLRPEAARLAARPETDGVAVATISRLQRDSTLFDVLAIESVKGTVTPTVVEGRVPAAPSEIMVGSRTLEDLGLHVGDSMRVSVGDRSAQLRVVGRGVLTEFAGTARLGEGATMTFDGARRLVPHAIADVVLVRTRPGRAGDALVTQLSHTRLGSVYLPAKPSDLVDLSRVGGLPSVIAALLGVMAVATLAHALFSSARRRRRDLAIFKVLGFRRRQVSAAIAWQAAVVAVIAVVVGVPLGIGAGRWGWQVFARRLGVPDQPVTPLLAILAVAGLALLIAILTAAVPARVAARTPAAVALRAE
jgi:ABC-type lipoprotein release transport system permease subunit